VGYTALVLSGGRSSRGHGAALLAGYTVVVVGFYIAGER
jgi:Ca2+/H+ antiporter